MKAKLHWFLFETQAGDKLLAVIERWLGLEVQPARPAADDPVEFVVGRQPVVTILLR